MDSGFVEPMGQMESSIALGWVRNIRANRSSPKRASAKSRSLPVSRSLLACIGSEKPLCHKLFRESAMKFTKHRLWAFFIDVKRLEKNFT